MLQTMEKQDESSYSTSESPQLNQETEGSRESCAPSSKDADVSKEPADGNTEDGDEYLSGIKFALLLSGVTLVCFLFLLDISIVSTVSLDSWISIYTLIVHN